MTTAFIRGILFISFEFRPLNLIRMRVVEIFYFNCGEDYGL